MDIELWKPIEGYEGLYEISNLGRVKRLERYTYDSIGRKQSFKEMLIKLHKDSNHYYLKVNLYKNGVGKPFYIHRLVYETFVGEIPEGMQVNHIDENKENNRVDNLNLMTPSQNINWGTRNAKVSAALRGKPKSPEAVAKSVAARSKQVEAIDKITGRVVYVFPSTNEAGRQGFDQGAVAACCRGEIKTHHGFIWRYSQ